MVNNYIPANGDIIYLNFNPTIGHEQQGYRPALVVSNWDFNNFTGLSLVCPITNNTKKHPLHVNLSTKHKTTGVILCEHIKSIDFNKRKVKFVEKLNIKEYEEVIDILTGFLKEEY